MYLGITLSGSQQTLFPSSKALKKVTSLALDTLSLRLISQKRYQRLLGSMNFIAPYILFGPFHLRQVILTSPSFENELSQPPSPLFRQHLHLWTQMENLEAPIPRTIPPQQLTVGTDSSKTGGGGNLTGHHGQRRLDPGGEPSPHQHPGVSGRHPVLIRPSPS